MSKRITLFLSLIVLLSMVLGACSPAPAAVATTVAPEVEVAQPSATPKPVEPTATPEPMLEPATPEQLDAAFSTFLADMVAYDTMKLEDLNTLLIDNPPYLLDVRTTAEAEEKGHIEGAVLIPLNELGDNLAYLPAFEEPIVSYCGSGWRCTIAMTALGALGWEDVKSLKGGSYGGWVEAGYPTVAGLPAAPETMNSVALDPSLELTIADMLANVPEGYGVIKADALNTALVENPDLILIDLRTQDEIDDQGQIEAPNTLSIPLETFIENRSQWPADLNAPIVTYCGSGHRSTIAMTILWAYGYTDVKSLSGGYAAWKDGGYAYTGGAASVEEALDAAYSRFLADMVAYDTMKLADLNTLLIENPPFLLDVRTTAEAEEKGHIEGSVLIPLNDLGVSFSYLPAFDEPIVSYCGSGWRCTIAITALGALGWEDTKALKENSYTGWVDAGYPTVAGLPPEAVELNAALIDPVLGPVIGDMLTNVPQGYGVITAEDLNTALVENPDMILIDARTQDEVDDQGVIDAANLTVIPLETFIENKALWPADKAAPIVVYCGSGHRSTIAMTILWSYGYEDVRSLKGGFGAWKDAGFATVAPGG